MSTRTVPARKAHTGQPAVHPETRKVTQPLIVAVEANGDRSDEVPRVPALREAVQLVPPDRLTPHPRSLAIYGHEPIPEDLKASVAAHGVLVPLIATPGGVIISGVRRWRAAQALGLRAIPVVTHTFEDELAERWAILEHNRHREKTVTQKLREAEEREAIVAAWNAQRQREAGVAGAQGGRGHKKPLPKNLGKGFDRHARMTAAVVARDVGFGSHETYRKAKRLKEAADAGDTRAQQLLAAVDRGEKTISAAHKDLIRKTERPSGQFNPKLWDVWIVKARDSAFGISHPGNIPAAIVENTLYYFCPEGGLVVDPFAGGGVTVDVAKAMGRRCLAYDISPRRPDIVKHDIRNGFPAEARGCDLVFMDPPYWSMLKDRYPDSSISSLTFAEWKAFLSTLARACFTVLRDGGHAAFLIQNQTGKDLPDGWDYIDHVFLAWEAFRAVGFRPVRRIACPMDPESLHPHQVSWAKSNKRMLGLVRDLVIYRKP
jgi:ParB family chromosome partitioning protein